MKLKELVPPLNLCKLIPKGEFAETALMWIEVEIPQENKKEWRVVNATKPILACHNPKYPAPTLEEILEELFFISNGFDLACFWDGGWHVKTNEGEKFSGISPVCGALKLWLELKGVEYEN